MSEAKAHEPAGLGRRLAAMLYDGLLLLAIWIVTGLIWFPINGAAVSGPLLTTAGIATARHWACAPGTFAWSLLPGNPPLGGKLLCAYAVVVSH